MIRNLAAVAYKFGLKIHCEDLAVSVAAAVEKYLGSLLGVSELHKIKIKCLILLLSDGRRS